MGWETPKVEEVAATDDSASAACQGKRIGCYAGSSCGSVTKTDADTDKDDKKSV